MDVCNNSLVAVAHIQARCRLQSHSCADTRGDTPCRFYSRWPPAAPCKNKNKADRLSPLVRHVSNGYMWSEILDPPFWGHELNCKHVESQCLTEICKDKQMWVNVPFQLQCLSYMYWRFNFKIPWIVSGLRIVSITNPQSHLMSCLEMLVIWK